MRVAIPVALKPSRQSLRSLDWLNFFVADVQTGVGPFVAAYLAAQGWQQGAVGEALTVGGLAGVLCQVPGGALVDGARSKRALVAAALATIAGGALVLAWKPEFWPVMLAQVSHGAAGSVLGPTLAAISLGLVGYRRLGERNGRNKRFDSAGNVASAALMGWIGYRFSTQMIFFVSAALSAPALLALSRIRPEEIDYARARGATGAEDKVEGNRTDQVLGLKETARGIFGDRRLLLFAGCAVMFHFANAAMLPLFGEMLAKGRDARQAPALMSGCVVVTQVIVALFATPVGRRADAWGRKPLLLLGFAALPVRGLLYTFTDQPALLIAIQVLDGIGAVAFGVVSVLVIADLTRGTGRFNLAQSAVGTAVGIGASLSNAVAGGIVQHAGFNAGFLFLAAVAALATALFGLFMPETRAAETM